jgi:hypothetical protein
MAMFGFRYFPQGAGMPSLIVIVTTDAAISRRSAFAFQLTVASFTKHC